jgi:hypothetical protein
MDFNFTDLCQRVWIHQDKWAEWVVDMVDVILWKRCKATLDDPTPKRQNTEALHVCSPWAAKSILWYP